MPATRYQARLQRAASVAEAALECTTSGTHVDAYNAALYAILGDGAAPFECASAERLDASRTCLHKAAGSPASAECLRALSRHAAGAPMPASASRRRSASSTSSRRSA